jgi:hypothetical protein
MFSGASGLKLGGPSSSRTCYLAARPYPREIRRDMPVGRTLRTRMWLVPAGELPAAADERVTSLNQWWTRIDEWIEQHQDAPDEA